MYGLVVTKLNKVYLAINKAENVMVATIVGTISDVVDHLRFLMNQQLL